MYIPVGMLNCIYDQMPVMFLLTTQSSFRAYTLALQLAITQQLWHHMVTGKKLAMKIPLLVFFSKLEIRRIGLNKLTVMSLLTAKYIKYSNVMVT